MHPNAKEHPEKKLNRVCQECVNFAKEGAGEQLLTLDGTFFSGGSSLSSFSSERVANSKVFFCSSVQKYLMRLGASFARSERKVE